MPANPAAISGCTYRALGPSDPKLIAFLLAVVKEVDFDLRIAKVFGSRLDLGWVEVHSFSHGFDRRTPGKSDTPPLYLIVRRATVPVIEWTGGMDSVFKKIRSLLVAGLISSAYMLKVSDRADC